MDQPGTQYRFFQIRQCEYFPCHKGIAEEDLNCLFCFCPLYALGKGCGGNYRYTASGDKDCSACTFPHRLKNYDRVLARYDDILAVAARTDAETGEEDQ